MTLKPTKASLLAAILCTVAAPAAMADMLIIQQGPSVGIAPQIQMPIAGASGFDMAAGFVTQMASERLPEFEIAHSIQLQNAPDDAFDPISFAGDWRMTEAPGISDEDLNESDLPEVTFSITADGHFTAYAGCNRIFGTLYQQGGALVDPIVGMTRMACLGLVGDQERALTRALDNAAMFAHAGGILVLLNADGDKLVEFHQHDAL